MSLREIAKQMKKKGRGPDTELVHMAPREVAGLRALAHAAGGSLTTNPDTGLPEAGFLESILPTLVGAGLAVVSGGTLVPVLAAAATGAMTNEEDPWMGAVTGAMGGYGGAGISNAFAGAAGAAGGAAATDAATQAAAQAGTDAAATAAADQAAAAAADQAAQQAAQQAAVDQAANLSTDQATQAALAEQIQWQQGIDQAANNVYADGLAGGMTDQQAINAMGDVGMQDAQLQTSQQIIDDAAAQQMPATAEEAHYMKVGRGAKNVMTGEEGAAENFIGKPATADAEATGLGGWRGAGDYAMKAAAPALAAADKNQGGGGNADTRGIMNSMREGSAPINRNMSDLGEDEAFKAAQRRGPGGPGAGIGDMDSFNKRPWFYEQNSAQGGLQHLRRGGVARFDAGGPVVVNNQPQSNSTVTPYGSSGDAGLGLAALAARIKRYQMPLEDQLAAAPVAAETGHAPMAAASSSSTNFKGGDNKYRNAMQDAANSGAGTGDEAGGGGAAGHGDGSGLGGLADALGFGGPGVDGLGLGSSADANGGNGGSNGAAGGTGDDGVGGSAQGGADAGGPGAWAQGGVLALAQGGMAQGGFVFPSDVVSALGNGSTAAGLRALTGKYGDVTPLNGAGDGLSDSIPTNIDGKRPARVADGEAYVSPETVAQVGGGNHAKGAKALYAAMDRVRKAAHGKTSQQRKVSPDRVLA